MNIDLLIIGGGPAGMAAAIQAARLGLSTAIVEKNRLGGQALAAPWIENYPGFPEGISGKELMAHFQKQLEHFPVEVIFDEIRDVEKIPPNPPLKKGGEGGFAVQINNKMISAKSILLAAGLTPKLAGIPGEIPYGNPDRIDHAGMTVLVVGGGDSSFDLAWSFAKKAKCVTVAMRGEAPRALPKLVERAVKAGVRIQKFWEISSMPYDVVISCAGKEAKHPLLEKIKKQIGPFELKAGAIGNAPGLFLAGDLCRGADRHVAIAVGDGIAAAQSAYRFLNPQIPQISQK